PCQRHARRSDRRRWQDRTECAPRRGVRRSGRPHGREARQADDHERVVAAGRNSSPRRSDCGSLPRRLAGGAKLRDDLAGSRTLSSRRAAPASVAARRVAGGDPRPARPGRFARGQGESLADGAHRRARGRSPALAAEHSDAKAVHRAGRAPRRRQGRRAELRGQPVKVLAPRADRRPVTTTISPPVRVVALVGALAAIALGILFYTHGRSSSTSSEPVVPAPSRTARPSVTPAHSAKPAATPKPKLALLPNLPVNVAHALRFSKVVVVSVYAGGARGDHAL